MIDPNNFIRIGTDDVGRFVYKLHLKHIDPLCPENALKLAKQAGGIQSTVEGGEYFVKFAAVDLQTLCKQIDHIIDGEHR